MPTFKYTGRDNVGRYVSGEMEATTSNAVAEKLLQKNITPIDIRLAPENISTKELVENFLQRKVPLEEMTLFCRQMYTLVKAGVPLVNALTRVSEATDSPLLAKALKQVVEQINGGLTLTAAMQNYPKVFNQVFVSIIDAGENAGRLQEAFSQLVGHLELESKTLSRLKTAMRYPIMVVIAISIAISVINFVVIPSFARMFEQFKTTLPLPTRILIGLSNFLLANWPYLLLGLIGIVIGLRYLLKMPQYRLIWDRWKLKIPVVGSIIMRVILARFARTFTMVIRTGVPIVAGIKLVAKTVGNTYVGDKISHMCEGIEKGESLTRTAIEAGLFSTLVIQMLSVGEEAGTVDDMLEQVAEFYEREVDYDLNRLSTLIEPIILVLMGMMVLILALGVFLPLWDMVNFAKR